EFYKLLTENNISVNEGPKAVRQIEINPPKKEQLKLIYENKGPELIEIINLTNYKSINLFAEHMLTLIAYEKTGLGSIENGVSTLENYWQGKINTDGLHINDGSGLSRTNAISAQNYVNLLQYMAKSKNAESFKNSLPIAGFSG